MYPNKRARIGDDRDNKLIKPKMEDFPEGYPRLAAFLNSDIDTALFRGFGTLHARVLLYKQVELTDIESRLDRLDKEDRKNNNRWRTQWSLHHNNGIGNEARKNLMDEANRKLREYDDLLLCQANIRQLARPSLRQHRNLLDYICTEAPFVDPDRADERFVYHEHDFVSLEEYYETWVDSCVHRLMYAFGILRSLFDSPVGRAKSSDPHLYNCSLERVDRMTKVIIIITAAGLFLIPSSIFLTLDMTKASMLLITAGFTIFFGTLISFRSMRRKEVFASTIVYCAVLVMLLFGSLQMRQLPSSESVVAASRLQVSI